MLNRYPGSGGLRYQFVRRSARALDYAIAASDDDPSHHVAGRLRTDHELHASPS